MVPDHAPHPGTLLDAHWLYLFQKGASIMVLQAYFDETHSSAPDRITAVAGFVFEPERLAEMHTEWFADPLITRMPWPHAAPCCNARPPFDAHPQEERDALMLRVNQLAARARGPGFVCYLHDDEFKAWAKKRRKPAIPNGYSMCVFFVLGQIRRHLEKAKDGRQIDYWFENGAAGQQDCDALLKRIRQSATIRDDYRMASYTFADKKRDPAFACADSLAWEWQRNLNEATRNDEQNFEDPGWRETFKAFYIDESSPPIVHRRLGPRDFDIAAMAARWNGIHAG